MLESNSLRTRDDEQQNSSSNYITVIPIEYPRNAEQQTQIADYMVEQYRTHDDYIQNEELSSSPGVLYSVSQHIPPTTAGYGDLCSPEGDYSNLTNGEWDQEQGSGSDTAKENGSEMTTEKPTPVTESNVTTAVPGSSNASTTSADSQAVPCNVIPICIYLMSRTAIQMEIEDTPSATADTILQAIINCEELNLNKQLAGQVFALWMCSPLLELQLKPTHKPYEVRRCWQSLLNQYSHESYNRQGQDEPIVSFQRNVFFSQQLEEKIKDHKIVELLYEEAKCNVLLGRYPCETVQLIMLGGMQARIELGPYNPQVHSVHFFREEQAKFLPAHIRKSATWTWLPISSKNSAEVRLLEQFKRIPTSATNKKLMKKYLEFCWALPFYGSAFFEGQVEQPVRGLTSLMTHQDIPVLVAINERGLYVIDNTECTVLLGLKYEEMSWDHARPSREYDPNCLPCLFIQFTIIENGARVSKILQVFSRQASMMDTLISGFVQEIKRKSRADQVDATFENQQSGDGSETHASSASGAGSLAALSLNSLSNKLSRLTLATFDEDGHCIGQMGSWSFSY